MTVFRRIRPPLHRGGLPATAGEEMPPRPVRQQPYPGGAGGADTIPRLAFGMGPVNPDWDPCGRPHPPLKAGSDEGEQA